MAGAAEVAYEVIQRAIASGECAPGTWLREEDAATMAGVSRTPVREAFRRLNAEGVLELMPNRGALVLGWTAQDLDDIHHLRSLLEGYAVRQAAESPGPSLDLDALHALCEQTERLLDTGTDEDFPAIGELSLAFHTALHRAAGSRYLMIIMPAIIQTPLVREGYHRRSRDDVTRSLAQHREILEAVAAHDGEWAESAMRAHIRSGRASLRRTDRHRTGDADRGPNRSVWPAPQFSSGV